jgi:biopolymer transport protein ExbD
MDHHRDPHAHYVEKSGRRLMRNVPLRFVQERAFGHRGRSLNASLNLTSYIDFLIVTVIFLLMSFSASGEVAVDKSITLPSADNVDDVLEAPLVATDGNQVLVDGTPAGSARIDGPNPVKIDGLFDLLKRKRDLWKSLYPTRQFPGVCILQIDHEVPALVVKSVFQTAAYAGYPNVSFMVRHRRAH